jgi:hypothetical protein
MEEGFEEQMGMQYWSPDRKGDELAGVVVSIEDGMLGDKPTGKRYLVDTGKGVFCTPSHAFLQARMLEVKVGDIVKILYEGENSDMKKKGQKAPKMYRVFRKKK